MKRISTILALIAAILSVILAVLPVSNLAIFPAALALLFGLTAFYISKKTGRVKKIIQFIFLLTIISLALTTYKAILSKKDVPNTEEQKKLEKKSKENTTEGLEELDLDNISPE